MPAAVPSWSFESFDVVSGIINSPSFKGKSWPEKLSIAAELIRTKKINQSDISFFLLDWTDRYLHEPEEPLQRLRRWSDLVNNEQLRHLRIPRDFFNRRLLTDYLVTKTPYVSVPAYDKLKLVRDLSQEGLVDWSVALEYARIYAGEVVTGSGSRSTHSPLESLQSLKKLTEDGLIGWHYRVPTESVLVSEVLALDRDYSRGGPKKRLRKLRDLFSNGLISQLNKRELEKIPAWRLLVDDEDFLAADGPTKKKRILKLKQGNLIEPATAKDLLAVFRLEAASSPLGVKPAVIPQKNRTTPE